MLCSGAADNSEFIPNIHVYMGNILQFVYWARLHYSATSQKAKHTWLREDV